MNTSPKNDSNATVLMMAMELSNSKWKLAFSDGPGRKARRREVFAGDVKSLMEEIKKAKRKFGLADDRPVVSCYEAGRDGFWIHRCLGQHSIDNLIVDSSSIEVNRRQRQAKTDRLDASKLLTMLMRWIAGETSVWRVVNPPTRKQEDARQLHRELQTLKTEQTRHNNRIKSLLVTNGIYLKKIDRELPIHLENIRLYDGEKLPLGLKQRILREFERMILVIQQIRSLEMERAKQIRENKTNPTIEKIRRLMELSAIGPASAWLFVHEVFGWRKIENRRQLGSLLGLTASPFNSGDQRRDQGISKAGNRRVRAMAIEIAWGWLRYQPDSQLSKWFEYRFGQGSKRLRRIGIVAVARKLVIALWKYLRDGEIPEGAKLRETNSSFSYTPSLR